MITSKQIRAVIKAEYPNAKNVWLRDKQYHAFSFDELEKFVNENTPITGPGDCDDFSTILHGKAKQFGLDPWKGTLAFGECLLNMYRGMKMAHSMNIAVTSDLKLYLVEPQMGGLWLADSKEDGVYFVWI